MINVDFDINKSQTDVHIQKAPFFGESVVTQTSKDTAKSKQWKCQDGRELCTDFCSYTIHNEITLHFKFPRFNLWRTNESPLPH